MKTNIFIASRVVCGYSSLASIFFAVHNGFKPVLLLNRT